MALEFPSNYNVVGGLTPNYAHGQVTRQDVMELCRVNENQAAYLLKKLVKSEELQLVGKGRTAAYTSLKPEKTRKKFEISC